MFFKQIYGTLVFVMTIWKEGPYIDNSCPETTELSYTLFFFICTYTLMQFC